MNELIINFAAFFIPKRMNMKIKIIILLLTILGLGNILYAQDFSAQKSHEIVRENGQDFYIHSVVKGNTLYNISKAYGVSPNVVKKYNKAIDDGLKLGMKLKIPVKSPKQDTFIYHIVKDKETLYHISKIYNVSVENIVELNHLKGKDISAGQYLKIPSDQMDLVDDIAISDSGTADKDDYDKDKYVKYKVQPKETLFSIGKRFGISVDALVYLNDLSTTDLSLGQELLIPLKLVENKNHQEEGADNFIIHKVKAKETLYGIAKEYAVSVNDIKKNNEFGDKEIQIGQNIKIPRTINKTGYIKHQVTQKKEKMSKIAADYSMSVSDLNKANPHIRKKAKRGQSIIIPLGYVESDFDKDLAILDEQVVLDGEPDPALIDAAGCLKGLPQEKTYQIALMLPLYLSEVDTLLSMDESDLRLNEKSKAFRFIEFYEGALIAAQEMNESGLDFEMTVYDIPRDVHETAEVLRDPHLKDMDLMISLSYTDSFELISDFSKTHDIPLVNALSKRREIIYNNPNVFKVEPQEDYLYQETAQFILDNYPEHNIIIVRSNQYQLAKQANLIQETINKGLKRYVKVPHSHIINEMKAYKKISRKSPEDDEKSLSEQQIANNFIETVQKEYASFDYSKVEESINDTLLLSNDLEVVIYSKDSLQGVLNASSLLRDNLIVAIGQDEIFAIELFTQLNSVNKSFHYEVIGLPYWDGFDNLDVSYTQPKKLKIVNHRFVEYSEPEVVKFVSLFRENYGIEPQIKKHAFLGYDLTKYFLTALKDYGSHFPNCINHVDTELLQNQMRFEHQEGRGYENINWNIIEQSDYKWNRVDR